ncbi:MAG: glycosyltransferase, partial [Pseudomonadota bacterium]
MIPSHPSLSQMGSLNAAEPILSVVIPTLNEQDNIDALLARLIPVLDDLKMPFEVIFVDDGSTDETARRIAERNRNDDRIKLVRFSRNFGKEAALNAGLFYSRGKAVI